MGRKDEAFHSLRAFALEQLSAHSPELYLSYFEHEEDCPYAYDSHYPHYPFTGVLCQHLDELIPSINEYYLGDLCLYDLAELMERNACLAPAMAAMSLSGYHVFARDESFAEYAINGDEQVVRFYDNPDDPRSLEIEDSFTGLRDLIAASAKQALL